MRVSPASVWRTGACCSVCTILGIRVLVDGTVVVAEVPRSVWADGCPQCRRMTVPVTI